MLRRDQGGRGPLVGVKLVPRAFRPHDDGNAGGVTADAEAEGGEQAATANLFAGAMGEGRERRRGPARVTVHGLEGGGWRGIRLGEEKDHRGHRMTVDSAWQGCGWNGPHGRDSRGIRPQAGESHAVSSRPAMRVLFPGMPPTAPTAYSKT
jgi:hypothetical protein